MFKKVSVSLRAGLRRQIERGNKDLLVPLICMLAFPGDVLRLLLGEDFHEKRTLPGYLDLMYKYFGEYPEHEMLLEATETAYRIETDLSLCAHDTIVAQMRFYHWGAQKPFVQLEVDCNRHGRIICASWIAGTGS